MQITFAGTIIAQEPNFGGFDTISGFMPSGKQQTQVAEFLRAPWATPYARGNRIHTLKGRIIPMPQGTLATALLARMAAYCALPQSGALVFQEGNAIVTFPVAVLESFEPVPDVTTGVSYGFELTFVASSGQNSTAPVLTEAGGTLLSESGIPIVT